MAMGGFYVLTILVELSQIVPIPSSHMTSILYIFHLLSGLSIQFLMFIMDVDTVGKVVLIMAFARSLSMLGLG
jgi:hypothetical protein